MKFFVVVGLQDSLPPISSFFSDPRTFLLCLQKMSNNNWYVPSMKKNKNWYVPPWRLLRPIMHILLQMFVLWHDVNWDSLHFSSLLILCPILWKTSSRFYKEIISINSFSIDNDTQNQMKSENDIQTVNAQSTKSQVHVLKSSPWFLNFHFMMSRSMLISHKAMWYIYIHQWTESTLVHIMAVTCLNPSHLLNQYGLNVN